MAVVTHLVVSRRYLIRALSLAVVSRRYLIRALSLPWPQLRQLQAAIHSWVIPVVSSQLVMTHSVVTRRYRLHRYRGAVVTRRYPYIVTSLHLVVTALYGCRYTSRR